jgi:hypothetical protein
MGPGVNLDRSNVDHSRLRRRPDAVIVGHCFPHRYSGAFNRIVTGGDGHGSVGYFRRRRRVSDTDSS